MRHGDHAARVRAAARSTSGCRPARGPTSRARSSGCIEAGAIGLKIHEDWGAYPEIIDATLGLADEHDVAVCLHTDGLNESCELADTVEAIGGRAVHAYHVEGAGGGHIPDLIGHRGASRTSSARRPPRPSRTGRATAAEHLEMILAVHGGIRGRPRSTSSALPSGSTRRPWPPRDRCTSSARSAIINSDSQGMGRIGETIRRTWQLAHAMKIWRASGAADGLPAAPGIGGIGGHGGSARPAGRQRARPALPRQVHGRARAGARHRTGGRLAAPGPARRHRAVARRRASA